MTALRDWYQSIPPTERGEQMREVMEVMGVTEAAVRHWMSGHRRPPFQAEQIAKLESVTGLTRQQLRPDVFGQPADAA